MGRDWDQIGSALRRSLLRAATGIVLLLLPLPLLAGEMHEAPFGGLFLRWDRAVWSVTKRDGIIEATCLADICKGRLVVGTVTPGGDCAHPAGEARRGVGETSLVSGPLRWRVATWRLGCRNAHPTSVEACAVHEGRAHRLFAPLLSCRTGPGSGSQEAILSLVRAVGP